MNRLASVILTNGRFELFARALRALRFTELPADWQHDITVIVNGFPNVDLTTEFAMADRIMLNQVDIGIAAAWNQAWGIVNAIDAFNCMPEPDMMCLVQDDALLVPDWFESALLVFDHYPDVTMCSGYNSPYHETIEKRTIGNVKCYTKKTLPGVHLVASVHTWESLFPIELEAHHTGEDWWFTRDAAAAPSNLGKLCAVIPGTCEHIGTGLSTWNPNVLREYIDPVNEVE